MNALASVVSLDEARIVTDLGFDVVDVKNPAEGSLGAQAPWVIREVAEYVNSHGGTTSATLGDLPFKPGTAALAALGAARLGVKYIKVGLHGTGTCDQARAMLDAVGRAVQTAGEDTSIVAAGYADFGRFDGLAPDDLVRAAAASGCQIVMLDTAFKDGSGLFDVMSDVQLGAFVRRAREQGLQVALAGSIHLRHLPLLRRLSPDIVGVRGALCSAGNRKGQIDARLAGEFLQALRRAESLVGLA